MFVNNTSFVDAYETFFIHITEWYALHFPPAGRKQSTTVSLSGF